VNGTKVDVVDNKFIIDNIQSDKTIQVSFTQISNSNDNLERDNSVNVVWIIIFSAISAGSVLLIFGVVKIVKIRKTKTSTDSVDNNLNLSENQHENQIQVNQVQNDKNVTNETVNQPSQEYVQESIEYQGVQTNNILNKAAEFVKGKEQHFISFCKRYNIDYINDYHNAIVRYYQAYLRSLKK